MWWAEWSHKQDEIAVGAIIGPVPAGHPGDRVSGAPRWPTAPGANIEALGVERGHRTW